MYAMQDIKTKFYHQPILCQNDAHARRRYTEIVEATPSLMRFPEDYRIYNIGTYDDSDAKIVPANPTSLLCEVTSLIEKKEE